MGASPIPAQINFRSACTRAPCEDTVGGSVGVEPGYGLPSLQVTSTGIFYNGANWTDRNAWYGGGQLNICLGPSGNQACPGTTATSPTISTLSPSSIQAGSGALTLTVNGSNFSSSSAVLWNGSNLPTTFVNPSQLTASIAPNLVATAGTASITVSTGGSTSSAATFTINPASTATPQVSSVSPSTVSAGSAAFTLTVNGANFSTSSVVQWNGSNLPTTFVASSQLTASVVASLVAAPGTASINVSNSGSTSAAMTFTITTTSTAGPQISSLSPSNATAGAATFTLTVSGTGFVAGDVVNWNAAALPTTFVSATQLQAQVGSGLIASSGTANITVSGWTCPHF